MSEGEIKIEADKREAIRVLVVEDEPGVSRFLKKVIDAVGGYEAIFTDNTANALKILEESKSNGNPIGLVFSDLGLTDNPEGGFEIARVVKAKQLARYFILFTGSAARLEGMSKEQLEEKGINLVVGKPVNLDVLGNCFKSAKESVQTSQKSI